MELFNQLMVNIKGYLETIGYSLKNLRNEFFINVNNHWCRIEVLKSTSSTKEYIKFTMNIGIHIPLDDSIQNLNNAQKISKLWFQLNDRIGFFIPAGKDYWWLITDKQSMQNASDEILKIIDTTIIPLFVKYTNEDNVLKMCMDNNTNRWFIDKYNKYRFTVLLLMKHKNVFFNNAVNKLRQYSVELDFVEETERFLKQYGIEETN